MGLALYRSRTLVFASIPLPLLTGLRPPHIIDVSLTSLLPLLDVLVRKPGSAESICSLLLPLLPITEHLHRLVPIAGIFRLRLRIGLGIVGLREPAVHSSWSASRASATALNGGLWGRRWTDEVF